MYDKTTCFRVEPANKPWNNMTEDQLWANMQGIWDRPAYCALSHMKAGIAQLERRGLLTPEEAAVNLKETLKTRRNAMRKKEAT